LTEPADHNPYWNQFNCQTRVDFQEDLYILHVDSHNACWTWCSITHAEEELTCSVRIRTMQICRGHTRPDSATRSNLHLRNGPTPWTPKEDFSSNEPWNVQTVQLKSCIRYGMYKSNFEKWTETLACTWKLDKELNRSIQSAPTFDLFRYSLFAPWVWAGTFGQQNILKDISWGGALGILLIRKDKFSPTFHQWQTAFKS